MSQFSAFIVNVKALYNVLKSISHQEFVIMRPMDEGLKLTVEGSKSSETSIYIPTEFFESYNIVPNAELMFKVSLKVLTECLNIFGDEGSSGVKIAYKGDGTPLCLIMKHKEENIMVDSQLATMDVQDFRDISLSDDCRINNIVFNGEQFFELFQDFDMNSDDFEINMKPSHISITTTSIMGNSVMTIPKQSETISSFQCKQDFSARYAFSDIKQIFKMLAYADKVSIITGDSGLLGIQLIINTDMDKLFVEFYTTALFEDD